MTTLVTVTSSLGNFFVSGLKRLTGGSKHPTREEILWSQRVQKSLLKKFELLMKFRNRITNITETDLSQKCV